MHGVNPQRFAVTVDILIVKRGNIEKASWGGLGVLCPGAPAAGCAAALQGAGDGDGDSVQLSRPRRLPHNNTNNHTHWLLYAAQSSDQI